MGIETALPPFFFFFNLIELKKKKEWTKLSENDCVKNGAQA
jgi:hypothetical protein